MASAGAKPVKVLPAMLSEVPKATMPTISTGTWSGTSTLVVSPTASSPASAEPRSITTSTGPPSRRDRGARPSTMR